MFNEKILIVLLKQNVSDLIQLWLLRFFAANALACAVAYVIFKCCYGTPREDSVDAARAKKAAAAAAAASVNRDGFLNHMLLSRK